MNIYGISIGGALILFTMVFGLFMKIYSGRARSLNAARLEEFFEKERTANSVRRKDISNLNYITIPYDTLPFIETDNYNIKACQDELMALKGRKILNLTGISNTDLKMEYGVANLPLLSEYDDNCLHMLRAISNLGFHLSKEGFHDEAIAFLEFGIACGSDIIRNYTILADEYIARGEEEKLSALVDAAEKITSMSKSSIQKELSLKLCHMKTE